ncbi:hypothetical protein GE061_019856 [Apolygus lucorum]|uniref:DUF4780 domain-containing protein n=1 Tax=Apolygus lucorum TaxID=248454 RepID=A0A8S9X9S5_APOLU|nr:hypothetical protein GE061_019856 [Apolygus lucorum]
MVLLPLMQKKPPAKKRCETGSGQPRVSPGAYSDALSSTKMAVTHGNHPAERLSDVEANLVYGSIVRAAMDSPAGQGPQFCSGYTSNGVVYVTCSNGRSKGWLEEQVAELKPWDGASLRTGPAKDLADLAWVKVGVWIPTEFLDRSDARKLIPLFEAQNPGLSTREWKLLNTKADPKGAFARLPQPFRLLTPGRARVSQSSNTSKGGPHSTRRSDHRIWRSSRLSAMTSTWSASNASVCYEHDFLDQRTPVIHLASSKTVNWNSKWAFLIYSNDVEDISSLTHFIRFADDTTAIIKGDTFEEVCRMTDIMIEETREWMNSNKMCLNEGKTATIDVTLRPAEAKCNEPVKYLGVMLDPTLTWSDHCHYLMNKVPPYF